MDSFSVNNNRLMRSLRAMALVLLTPYLVLGLIAAYRAWYQVHRLELVAESSVHSGSVISTNVVSYARTTVTVRLELVQGGQARELMSFDVAGNDWPFWDPRTRTVTRNFIASPETLAGFRTGSAQLRAIAIGRPQWTRLPPPVISEVKVQLEE